MFTKPFTKQQTLFQQNKNSKKTGIALKKAVLALSIAFTLFSFTSCGKNNRPIVIWTNITSVASYVEYFNATHQNQKAIVIYKPEPVSALPPSEDELTPDIIVGSWLKNSATKKTFSPLNSVFNENVNEADFYDTLLEYGVVDERQYLLPVSFNLPLIVFSTGNEDIINTSHFLSIDQIKRFSQSYNTLNRSGDFASMGYGPSWDTEFLYECTKLFNTDYSENGTSFDWNDRGIEKTISYLKQWTTEANSSTTAEKNFQFKYLFMPKQKQVSSGRCLFAYMTSDQYFALSEEQMSLLAFRWLSTNETIPVEDNVVSLGLYRYSHNKRNAKVFINWFMNSETQKNLLERSKNLNLDTQEFGIAGGFSSIQAVNEKTFPIYYRKLLENLPGKDHIKMPNNLPYTWPDLKENIILPYLSENTNTSLEEGTVTLTMEERIADWNRQYY